MHDKASAESEGVSYRFTGKEQDPETELYYHGARYRDPKLGTWLSVDPILNDYLPVAPVNDETKENNKKLPGHGGVFNHINLNLYHYAANSPVMYSDPDGKEDLVFIKNANPEYKKFESSLLVYDNGVLTKEKVAALNIMAKVRQIMGGTLTERDVINILGTPKKKYDNWSTLPNDPQTQGTAKSGLVYKYKQQRFNGLDAFLQSDHSLYAPGGLVPQDSNYNDGTNPSSGKKFVDGSFLHTARGGNPNATNPPYGSGSEGCVTRFPPADFNTFYNEMMASPTGSSGQTIIFR